MRKAYFTSPPPMDRGFARLMASRSRNAPAAESSELAREPSDPSLPGKLLVMPSSVQNGATMRAAAVPYRSARFETSLCSRSISAMAMSSRTAASITAAWMDNRVSPAVM